MAEKKTESKTEVTKAPSGLTITRAGNKFTFAWKIDDDDYDKGQQLEYKINKGSWTSISGITKETVTKVLTITAANYFPTTSVRLETIAFRVRGKRKDSTKESSKKIINYTYEWSDWSSKKYTIKKPRKPSLTATLSDEYANSTTFEWEVEDAGAEDETWFTDVVYQTILEKDYNGHIDASRFERLGTGWATASGQAATGSITKTETLTDYSITRVVRAKSRGPAGETDWRYAEHVYARPLAATIGKKNISINSSGYQFSLKWNVPNTKAHPVDKVVIQEAVATPAAGMTAPVGASWTDVLPIKDTKNKTSASFMVSETISTDQALFLRLMSEHDPYDTSRAYSEAFTSSLLTGALATPTNLSVSQISASQRTYSVSATNNSDVPGSYLVVCTCGPARPDLTRKAVIPAGSTSPVTIKVGKPIADAFSVVVFAEVKGNGASARSDQVIWNSSSLPTKPTGLTLESAGNNTVLASWTTTWSDAVGTEISWSQDPNAWESTTDPESYTINTDANQWYINDITLGMWYFKVRSFDEESIYSPWSNVADVNIAENPATPVLSVSAGKIGLNGNTSVSWTYVNSDGSSQAYAEVRNATVNGSTVTRGTVIATAEASTAVTLYAKDIGWSAGIHYVVVRVTSDAGKSSEWSAPIAITVAAAPTATISATNLSTVTVTDDVGVTRSVTALTAMPLTLTVTGADAGGTTTVAVERAESYHMERPDEDDFDGFEGETIAIKRQTGDAQMSITSVDLIGRFDDGAKYRIVAEVSDEFGQTARATQNFEVRWSHQARIPSATILVDEAELIAKITPVKPGGASNNDVCDIYRLSADKPELIFEGAAWGTTYVDPYPAFGEYGGHRVVLRTANGDYITSANKPAWRDYDEDDDDILELHYPATVIDFDGNRALLRWNMSVSSAWSKDFVETKYLGGAVQGDWNAAVSRTSSVSVTVVTEQEPVLVSTMRRLADYPGICHIRTPEGSSFAADIQVSETSGAKLTTFDLTITRVDPEGFDGMTLAQWQEEFSE